MAIKQYRDTDGDSSTFDPRDPISFSEILQEFGVDADPSFKDYYRDNAKAFVKSANFDKGYTEAFAALQWAQINPNDNTRMLIFNAGVQVGLAQGYAVQPGERVIITNDTTGIGQPGGEIQIEVENQFSPSGRYRIRHRDAANLIIPKEGSAISFSDFYGSSKDLSSTAAEAVEGVQHIKINYGSRGEPKVSKNVTLLDLLDDNATFADLPFLIRRITLTIPSDYVIYSDNPSTPALSITGIPDTIDLTINVSGHVLGAGGEGGSANIDPYSTSRNGGDGGTGLYVDHDGLVDINIVQDNDSSTFPVIAGGGGGGGAGYMSNDQYVAGGGGGGGAGWGDGGDGFIRDVSTGEEIIDNAVRHESTTYIESPTVMNQPGNGAKAWFDFLKFSGDDPNERFMVDLNNPAEFQTSLTTAQVMDAIIPNGGNQGGPGGNLFDAINMAPGQYRHFYTSPDYKTTYDDNLASPAPASVHTFDTSNPMVPAGMTNAWCQLNRGGGYKQQWIIVDGEVIGFDTASRTNNTTYHPNFNGTGRTFSRGGFVEGGININESNNSASFRWFYYKLVENDSGVAGNYFQFTRTNAANPTEILGTGARIDTRMHLTSGAGGGIHPTGSHKPAYPTRAYNSGSDPFGLLSAMLGVSNIRRMHNDDGLTSIGGYGGSSVGVSFTGEVDPSVNVAGGRTMQFTPTNISTSNTNLPDTSDRRAGGGAGGGGFGGPGGQAGSSFFDSSVGIYRTFSTNQENYTQLQSTGRGGQPGSAIEVNDADHVTGNSSLPEIHIMGAKTLIG